MKPRHLMLGAALLLALGLVLFGQRAPDDEAAQAVVQAAPRQPPRQAPRRALPAAPAPSPVLSLIPRSELFDHIAGSGHASPFGSRDWTPAPAPAPASAAPATPVAPPLPFAYLGKALRGGQWEVYLAQGDTSLIVRPQMVIEGRYRVEAIAPPLLTLRFLPLNQIQQINIGVLD